MIRNLLAIAFAASVAWVVFRLLDRHTAPGGAIHRITDTFSKGGGGGTFLPQETPGEALSVGYGGTATPTGPGCGGGAKCACG